MIKFEWDEAKAASNLKKHQVSFEEAKSIFFDEFGVQFRAYPVNTQFRNCGLFSGRKWDGASV